MRGREEPPLSEGGSHWRVAEKGMRSTTLEFSGIVGGTADIKKQDQSLPCSYFQLDLLLTIYKQVPSDHCSTSSVVCCTCVHSSTAPHNWVDGED